ncbi:Polysialic acid transport protein KpsM [Rhizobium rhizogenes]|uniref:Transport permease protein n=2 Tax=Rhizobium/Agrobacterium group TaxID=227290 RepID=A0A546XXS5_AGRTU|nr:MULTISPECIES: ABC transporter permease [Rhizobium/Agrobacterium group]AQS63447.1 ABC transporter permease [Rhizobium rhizogenes]MCZ7441283.1 ABC transporter permease [Rhizobium rhizogenes]NSX94017.1 ABC transporter permease [Agrobacterium tumefaciens]NSZ82333.1 ABC transporter permease [Agrobacterium tumefaciens]NTE56976.1 ABC transporter permease [Agrobacterium tumefaciens]
MYYLKAHIRVVGALLIREMSTRFGSKPGGYVWAIIDPAGHIAFMSLIFMAITHTPALGKSFALFFATGYLAFQFYAAMAGFLNGAIKANRTLLSYPNVAPIDTIVARYILQAGTTSVVSFCVLGVILLTVDQPVYLNWPAIIEAAFAATVLGLGIGIFNNVATLRFPLYEQVFNIINRPMFLISGVFFLPDALPAPIRDIVLLNPLVHVVMLFRKGFYPEYRADMMNMTYLYSFALTILFMGLLLFTRSASVLRSR